MSSDYVQMSSWRLDPVIEFVPLQEERETLPDGSHQQ